MSRSKPKLIAIVGPNASGKTSLSIKLAKKFNGQIISADSRQVYLGLDIGTGKATKKEQKIVKHFLIDTAKATQDFNVSHFKKKALQAIKEIYKSKKLPFIVGGTGFWIQSVIDNINFPAVKPDKKLRQQLEKKTTNQLYQILKKLDPSSAKRIDRHNPYRLIRAIEIIKTTKKPIPKIKKKPPFNLLMLGITHPQAELYRRISLRLKKRFKQGMINEVKKLKRRGLSWQRLYDFGLEYRYISLFLRNKLKRPQLEEQLQKAIQQYAKRQLTWFKRDQRIHWITSQAAAESLIKKFINK